jgi:hypothetical protein
MVPVPDETNVIHLHGDGRQASRVRNTVSEDGVTLPDGRRITLDDLITEKTKKFVQMAENDEIDSFFMVIVPKKDADSDGGAPVPMYSYVGRWGLKDWIVETDFIKNILLSDVEGSRMG